MIQGDQVKEQLKKPTYQELEDEVSRLKALVLKYDKHALESQLEREARISNFLEEMEICDVSPALGEAIKRSRNR